MNPSEYEDLFAEAIAHSQRGESAEAIACLERLTGLPGSGGDACHLLAAEYVAIGRLQEAEEAFAEAILRAPELLVARFQLGLLQVTQGRRAAGQLTWTPLLSLPRLSALRCYVEGYVALINDQFAEATAHFSQGLELPQDNEALMGDIRKTLEAMSTTMQGKSADNTNEQSSAVGQHVLLSNYSMGDRRH